MQAGKIYALCLLFTCLITGCSQPDKAPDVSNIPMQVSLSRFDQAFMSVNTKHLQAELQKLKQQYPVFFPIYMNRIMNFNNAESNAKQSYPIIKKFIQSKDIQNLQDTINAHFTRERIKKLQNDLNKSFRYIKYYFPDFHPPKVVTFMSALSNYGAITVDSVLGVGLDMFLGKDFILYKKLANPYPDYILKRFSPNNLVVSCMKALARKNYPPQSQGTLLDQMIAHGKILYFLDKVLPHTSDSLKIHYSQKQLDWCKKNEQFIWQYFIRNSLLYKKKSLTIRYYIGPGPSSRGMPKNAPGNIGSWVGWQIIRKYMKENPKVSLATLMKLTDSQKTLNLSGYQPH